MHLYYMQNFAHFKLDFCTHGHHAAQTYRIRIIFLYVWAMCIYTHFSATAMRGGGPNEKPIFTHPAKPK